MSRIPLDAGGEYVHVPPSLLHRLREMGVLQDTVIGTSAMGVVVDTEPEASRARSLLRAWGWIDRG